MASENGGLGSASRRSFLKQVSTAAVAGMAAGQASADQAPVQAAASKLPTISLGKHRVSRLIVGSNPINGYSYMGPHADRHMRDYFTRERTVEFLRECEQAGINTLQFSVREDVVEAIAESRRQGSTMNLICLHADRKAVADVVKQTGSIAMVHHGGVTDKLFGQGRGGEVHDYVKAARDAGVLAGVSAHNPDNIKRIADAGWEVDLFMTCFYFLTRAYVPETKAQVDALPTLEIVYPFFKDDPQVMTEVIRQVDQPCLAFKILAAGRMCSGQPSVRAAFEFAFQRIKPADGVIVGMYPRFFDEIQANAGYTREFGSAKTG